MKSTALSKITGALEKLVLRAVEPTCLSIQLDLTNACNLACNHCYHPNHSNKGGLDLKSWIEVLDQYEKLLQQLGARPNIAICGGEPLVSPHFYPVLDNIVSRWPRTFVGVMTNGTLIEKHIENLKRYPLYFQVSLEAPTAFEHDKIRGQGSFDKTMSGVKLLQIEKFDVHVLVVLSKRTALTVFKMFEFAKSQQLKSLNYTRAIPMGVGSTYFKSNLDRPLEGLDLRDALHSIVSASRAFNVSTNTDKPLYALIDPALGHAGAPGFQGLVIGYKGELKASSRTDLVLGDVLKEGLDNLFFHNLTLQKLRKNRIPSCESCNLIQKCGGDRSYAYSVSGDFLGVDTGCWKLNRFERE